MWIIEIERGTFEADTLEELSNDVATRYLTREATPAIKYLRWQEGDLELDIEPLGLTEFSIKCDSIIEEMIKDAAEEEEHIRMESGAITSQWL